MQDKFIGKLEKRLQAPLPGPEAQYRMAHVARRSAETPPAGVKLAGVLALFFPKGDDWHLVFIERSTGNPQDRHGGQISFPGGRYEDQDQQAVNTALREAEEEVGVSAQKVRIIGNLSDLYIPVSNFLVKPFVGFTSYTPRFRPQAEEVNDILEVPFSIFENPKTIQTIDLPLASNITLKNVPYYNLYGKILWGATAMMMSELLEVAGRRERER